MRRRVLFICEGNIHRSVTAQRLYATTPGIETRSAGLSPFARVQVTEELLIWAEDIFVMERRLAKMLRRRFKEEMTDRKPITLDIPDDYQCMQPELLAILTEKLVPYLRKPIESMAERSVPPQAIYSCRATFRQSFTCCINAPDRSPILRQTRSS